VSDQIAVALGPGAQALFTTRRGGVSEGPYASLNLGRTAALWAGHASGDDDEDAAVVENRERVSRVAGVDRAAVAMAEQVHGARVARAGEPQGEPADGQVVIGAGAVALVLTADCLPVALAGDGAAAMLHCGWRGLAQGIVAEGVRVLGAPGRLTAAIGPGIGPCCFEVGDEVRDAFSHHGSDVRRGRHLDLKLIARSELEAVGVAEIADVGLCTACEGARGHFFSHRRDGPLTGRQAGLAWVTG